MTRIDPLIPFRQAIAMAGMKATKAYSQVAAGRIQIIKNGRNTFIRESELTRYLDMLGSEAEQKKPEKKIKWLGKAVQRSRAK